MEYSATVKNEATLCVLIPNEIQNMFSPREKGWDSMQNMKPFVRNYMHSDLYIHLSVSKIPLEEYSTVSKKRNW